MRQRNIKNLDEKLKQNSAFLIEDPAQHKGNWSRVFGNDNPIYLEIGCGKGQFITRRAESFPKANYIAIEGQSNVALRALEKAQAEGMENLRIFIAYVHDLEDYFKAGELAGIYLNFSDPWPKARHAKRRLTHRRYLEGYRRVLSKGGFVEIKTDNDALFAFTLQECEAAGLTIQEQTHDLHQSELPARHITTQYENRFRLLNEKIHYCRIQVD